MPWPKGKPLKGHVNKDGTPHRPRSAYRLAKEVILREMPSLRTSTGMPMGLRSDAMTASTLNKGKATPVSSGISSSHGETTSSRVASPRGRTDILSGTTPKSRKYNTKLAHPQYIIEPCPNCQFPEADGGYCPDCGWSAPLPALLPANSVHGRIRVRV